MSINLLTFTLQPLYHRAKRAQPANGSNRLNGLNGLTGKLANHPSSRQGATEAHGLGAEAAADGVEGCHQVVVP